MRALLYLCLIQDLGSADFRTRERTSAYLAKNVDAAIVGLMLGEMSGDPEIRQRCRPLVNDWYRRHAEKIVDAFMPSLGRWPWSDGLAYCQGGWEHEFYPESYHYYTVSFAVGKRGAAPDWEAWSWATRLWMIDRIAARLPVVELLRKLVEGELQWRKSHGYEVPGY